MKILPAPALLLLAACTQSVADKVCSEGLALANDGNCYEVAEGGGQGGDYWLNGWRSPIDSDINDANFGACGADYFYDENGVAYRHIGADYTNGYGVLQEDPVYAIGDGTVLNGDSPSYGGWTCDSGSTTTNVALKVQYESEAGSFIAVYGHLEESSVVGSGPVSAGDVLGLVGDYPCGGNPGDHLHFGIFPGTEGFPASGWGLISDDNCDSPDNTNGFVAPYTYLATYAPAGTVTHDGYFSDVSLDGTSLTVSGKVWAAEGIEKFTITVGDDTASSDPSMYTADYGGSATEDWFGPITIELGDTDLATGSHSVGLWVEDTLGVVEKVDEEGPYDYTAPDSTDCTASDYQQCYGGDVYWYDSCGNRGGVADNCSSSETCVDSSATEASCEDGCTSSDYQQCYADDVYWYDSCGNREGVADNCSSAETCVDSSSTTASCDDACSSSDYQQCYGGDVYWYDSCGNRESVADTCSSSETCVDESSTTANCETSCTSSDYQQCYGGDVYWYDSCGSRESVADNCSSSETCVDSSSTTASCDATCTESDYWTATSMSDSDEGARADGSTYGTGDGVTLDVEFQDDGAGDIEFQICKGTGNFSGGAIWVVFDEDELGMGVIYEDAVSTSSSSSCTSWISLDTSAWSEGDRFGGDMHIESPSSAGTTWGSGCSDDGATTGDCWFLGGFSSMERTCL